MKNTFEKSAIYAKSKYPQRNISDTKKREIETFYGLNTNNGKTVKINAGYFSQLKKLENSITINKLFNKNHLKINYYYINNVKNISNHNFKILYNNVICQDDRHNCID